MSARFPVWNPAAPYRQTFHGCPESTLSILWERGYKTRLMSTELNSSTTEFEIEASRSDIRACMEEDNRRVSQYHTMDTEHHRAITAAKYGNDYDGNKVGALHRFRVYFWPEQIVETLEKHGIRIVNDTSEFLLNTGIVLKMQPHHCFRIVQIKCAHTKFRAAQFEWLRKMSNEPPIPLRKPRELDLFL